MAKTSVVVIALRAGHVDLAEVFDDPQSAVEFVGMAFGTEVKPAPAPIPQEPEQTPRARSTSVWDLVETDETTSETGDGGKGEELGSEGDGVEGGARGRDEGQGEEEEPPPPVDIHDSAGKLRKRRKTAAGMPIPSLDEVRKYVKEKAFTFDPETFHAHYEANGWQIGKNPMRRWHMACVTWEKRRLEGQLPNGVVKSARSLQPEKHKLSRPADYYDKLDGGN